MRLSQERALSVIVSNNHGVLATTHAERGADVVPVVYASDGSHIAVPIDTVKSKANADRPLQREFNLRRDPRASLLVEHWDFNDWSQLWWVRAQLRYIAEPSPTIVDDLAQRIVDAYAQYRNQTFARLIVFAIIQTTGWSAAD